MMNNTIKDYMTKIGKRGGATTAKRGKEYYAALGRRGMAKRWGKKTSDSKGKRGPDFR